MLSSHDHALLCYAPRQLNIDRPKWKPNVEIAPNCPRCDSPNTKFCYYNNYSLSQPRYFCKGCRRYWTKGGSLRNVPVGGGCRKTRRGKSMRLSTNSTHNSGPTGHAHKPTGPLARPDHDLVGNSGPFHGLDSGATSGDSSEIDLAVLYAKFLNQSSEPELIGAPEMQREVELESIGSVGGMSDSSLGQSFQVQLARDQEALGFDHFSHLVSANEGFVGEFSNGSGVIDDRYSVLPLEYQEFGSVPDCLSVLPDLMSEVPVKYQEFGSVPYLHENIVSGEHWNSLDEFYMCSN